MKRVLFIISHFCSGSGVLYCSLDKHPKIQGFRSNNIYTNVQDLMSLASNKHKLDNTSAIYLDELLTNNSIRDKAIYNEIKCVFLIREPEGTLNEIILTKNYKPKQALNYYLMRLRRMYSIAMRSPDSVLLTYSDLEAGRGGDLIEEYLRLSEVLIESIYKKEVCEKIVPTNLLDEATIGFEYWLDKIKQLGLSSS